MIKYNILNKFKLFIMDTKIRRTFQYEEKRVKNTYTGRIQVKYK